MLFFWVIVGIAPTPRQLPHIAKLGTLMMPIKADSITAAVGDNVIQFGDDGFATGTIPITGVLRLPMLLLRRARGLPPRRSLLQWQR